MFRGVPAATKVRSLRGERWLLAFTASKLLFSGLAAGIAAAQAGCRVLAVRQRALTDE